MFERLLQNHFNKNIIGLEKICKVIDNIYLGNNLSRDYILHFNIKKVIEIGIKEEIKHYKKLPEDIEKLSVIINTENKLFIYYDKVWDFIEQNYNKNILIHCNDGNYSMLLLISYLIAYKHYSYDNAFELIMEKKDNNFDINLLNKKYIEELIQLDKNLHNFKHLINTK